MHMYGHVPRIERIERTCTYTYVCHGISCVCHVFLMYSFHCGMYVCMLVHVYVYTCMICMCVYVYVCLVRVVMCEDRKHTVNEALRQFSSFDCLKILVYMYVCIMCTHVRMYVCQGFMA